VIVDMSWEPIVAKAQAAVHSAIPEKWRLPKTENLQGKCVLSIPRTCGVLTADQLDITEQTATELLAKLARGKLRSVDVVDAFCARAAIAHQLVFLPIVRCVNYLV
jgi:amidase